MTSVETVELTEEDFLNILKWWTATGMTAEAGLRTKFSESERNTMSKITKAREQLQNR